MVTGELSENVIIIDAGFLNEVAKDTYDFYSQSKPDKEIKPYNFGELVYTIAHNARLEALNERVDVILGYHPLNDRLNFCEQEYASYFILEAEMDTDIGNFVVRSFFGKESDDDNIPNIIEIVDHCRLNDAVKNIILVADNAGLNKVVNDIVNEGEKSVFMFKLYHGSKIDADVYYVNLGHIVALCFGIAFEEQ